MLDAFAAIFATVSLCAHAWSAHACARARKSAPAASVGGFVSLVIPLCGVETFSRETLAAALNLSYPRHEVIFCVARERDPIIPLVHEAMVAAPNVQARLLIGNDVISANPMLNNVAKGWRAARGEWVALINSNVLMPRDYLAGMLAQWKPNTGVVCAPPVGIELEGFGAAVEAAFLNTYQARWQYAADAAGQAFAQGKGVLWRKATLDANGGIEALGVEAAEDAATTKLVRGLGLAVRLAAEPSYQPLGRRRSRDVWDRQVRWARLRRVTFPLEYSVEIATSGLLVALAAGIVCGWPCALATAVAWYGVEDVLAIRRGWPAPALGALLARDALLPAVWLAGWLGNGFEWRGNRMSVSGERH